MTDLHNIYPCLAIVDLLGCRGPSTISVLNQAIAKCMDVRVGPRWMTEKMDVKDGCRDGRMTVYTRGYLRTVLMPVI